MMKGEELGIPLAFEEQTKVQIQSKADPTRMNTPSYVIPWNFQGIGELKLQQAKV